VLDDNVSQPERALTIFIHLLQMPAMAVSHYLMSNGCVDRGDPPGVADNETERVEPFNIFEGAFATLDSGIVHDIQSRVERARQDVTSRIQEYDIQVLSYHHFGSSGIKKSGCSPDAFVQVAMQLASYRLYGKPVGTYEATQMRAYLHGRTETTRGVSSASKSFVESICRPQSLLSDEDKRTLLRNACDVHSASTRRASAGQGVDRHFYGLANLLGEGEAAPSLFEHELFKKSKRWRLSTSTVPGVQCGFSCVDDDGLGIGYDVHDDKCVFTVAGRKDRQYVGQMTTYLSQALDDMMVLLRRPAPSSRL
jgi:carnitine O-acetyltransferase